MNDEQYYLVWHDGGWDVLVRGRIDDAYGYPYMHRIVETSGGRVGRLETLRDGRLCGPLRPYGPGYVFDDIGHAAEFLRGEGYDTFICNVGYEGDGRKRNG